MTTLTMPLVFERRFQLWSYSVGHSVLLLRSNIGPETGSRIDLMFRSVTAMKLRHLYKGITVDVASPDDFGTKTLQFGDIGNRFIFTLGATDDDLGYVVASSLFFSEDDLEDGRPSTIDHRELADHIIASGAYR